MPTGDPVVGDFFLNEGTVNLESQIEVLRARVEALEARIKLLERALEDAIPEPEDPLEAGHKRLVARLHENRELET